MLLIVDECHQCCWASRGRRSLLALDFVREIHDVRKCGVVLCGTNVFRDEIRLGKDSPMLRQLWLRNILPLQLPDVPTERQLATFAQAYGLSPAPDRSLTPKVLGDDGADINVTGNPADIQKGVIRDDGLGRWLAILQESADLAASQKRRITWGHVILTHAMFRAMETVAD